MVIKKMVFVLCLVKNSTGSDQPTWGMAFTMKDGKPLILLYLPYNLKTFWLNRDPRFVPPWYGTEGL